jgi:uncharacterized DUF497 family protein
MDFEWSESKRFRVLEERGIDFLDVAEALFDGRPVLTVPSPRYGEVRYLSLVSIEGKVFAAIWMWRGVAVRLVTARRARDGEEKRYHAAYG